MVRRDDSLRVGGVEDLLLHLNLSANACGFDSVREALVYAKITKRSNNITQTYISTRRILFGHHKCVCVMSEHHIYGFFAGDGKDWIERRLRRLARVVPSVSVARKSALTHLACKPLNLALQVLSVCPFSITWNVTQVVIPKRNLSPTYSAILHLRVQEEEWTTAFDLCDLQHEILHCDVRKDRVPDLPAHRLRDNSLLKRLLPAVTKTMPERGEHTYVWGLSSWVSNGHLAQARLLLFRRRRLARLLHSHSFREALYRPPLGYIFCHRAKTTMVGRKARQSAQ
jgi:hypothetical protein